MQQLQHHHFGLRFLWDGVISNLVWLPKLVSSELVKHWIYELLELFFSTFLNWSALSLFADRSAARQIFILVINLIWEYVINIDSHFFMYVLLSNDVLLDKLKEI